MGILSLPKLSWKFLGPPPCKFVLNSPFRFTFFDTAESRRTPRQRGMGLEDEDL